jgi:large subunit ribosomal protein L9
MEVILMERVEKLLPQRKALRATKGNMERFENQRVHLEADNLERRQEAEKVSEKLQGLTVVLIRQAGESGQLYGSVNTKDLAQAVTEAGIRIERRQVILDKVIKSLGLYPVRIQLHPEVAVEVSANVARSDEEAEAQAKAGRMISAEELREAEEAQEAEIEAVVEAVVMEEEEKTASNDETQSEEVEDKET